MRLDTLTEATKSLDSDPTYRPFDSRNLSYGGTFPNSVRGEIIRAIEWMTGKVTLIQLVRKFERTGRKKGQSFWGKALELLDIELLTPDQQIQRIPKSGPLVVVANHPHGLVDGLMLAELVSRVRQDFKILTRSLLSYVPEIQYHMLPVAFPHEEDTVRKNVAMRKAAMDHLSAGGAVILFPAGQVANAPGWNMPVEEPKWNPFTAKLIVRSGARVVPVYFAGENSRWYQWANLVSATLRQSLLLHEIVHSMHEPQKPVIGGAIGPDEIKSRSANGEEFMVWLRNESLSLRESG